MTWTAHDYMNALAAKLAARAGLQGVQITTAPINNDDVKLEGITLSDVDTIQEEATIGHGNRDDQEEYVISCAAWCYKEGKGEDVAVAARARAVAILAEIESELGGQNGYHVGLNSLGNQRILMARMSARDLRQGINDGYRRAIVPFEILVKARV